MFNQYRQHDSKIQVMVTSAALGVQHYKRMVLQINRVC